MLQNCRKVDLLIIPAGYNKKSDNNTNFNDNNHNYENKFQNNNHDLQFDNEFATT